MSLRRLSIVFPLTKSPEIMAVTTLVTVMAATIMFVSSASLPQDVATSSPDVATTTEASERAFTAKEEMNQCIDRLQLDDRYVADLYLVYVLPGGSCSIFQAEGGYTKNIEYSAMPLTTSLSIWRPPWCYIEISSNSGKQLVTCKS